MIINVSSASGQMPGTPYGSWYSVSKHALNTLTEAMFIELDGLAGSPASSRGSSGPTSPATPGRTRLHRPPTTARTRTSVIRPGWPNSSTRASSKVGATSVDVAEAIGRAYDPATPPHNLIGDDAFSCSSTCTGRPASISPTWLPVRSPSPNRSPAPCPLRHGGPDRHRADRRRRIRTYVGPDRRRINAGSPQNRHTPVTEMVDRTPAKVRRPAAWSAIRGGTATGSAAQSTVANVLAAGIDGRCHRAYRAFPFTAGRGPGTPVTRDSGSTEVQLGVDSSTPGPTSMS